MNDGACDPAGRFLAGTMTFDRRPNAGLYRLEPDLTINLLIPNVTLSNGIDWAPDGQTMYHVDTPTRQIIAFNYDIVTGNVSEGRIFASLSNSNGNPDGLTVDAEGYVWVAVFRAGEIRRYAPNGKLAQTITLPTPLVTSCCFGGPDLEDLYVTSAARAMTPAQLESDQLAGALFRIHTDTQGQTIHRFAG